MCEDYAQELEYLVNRAVCQSNLSTTLPNVYMGNRYYRIAVEHTFDVMTSHKTIAEILADLQDRLERNDYEVNIRATVYNGQPFDYRIYFNDKLNENTKRHGLILVSIENDNQPRIVANINNFIRGFPYTLDDISTTGNSRIYHLKSKIRIW